MNFRIMSPWFDKNKWNHYPIVYQKEQEKCIIQFFGVPKASVICYWPEKCTHLWHNWEHKLLWSTFIFILTLQQSEMECRRKISSLNVAETRKHGNAEYTANLKLQKSPPKRVLISKNSQYFDRTQLTDELEVDFIAAILNQLCKK